MEESKFVVKEVNEVEQKSTAQVEEELLQKHEEQFTATESVEGAEKVDTTEEVQPEPEADKVEGLKDEDVLEYIKSRYDKEINSVDELFAQTKANEELPEDVSAFFKYKKETGRGFDDYVKLQKNYEDMDGDTVIANYYSQTEEGLDEIDIQDIIEDKFGYDEDLDDEKDVKKKKLAHKRELVKAKKFFKEQQEQYKIPLESSGGFSSEEQTEEFNRYKSYVEESTTREEQMKKRYSWFVDKSNEVLNDDFKGFNFNVNDKEYTFKPGDGKELFNKQKDVNNFVKPYLDSESGMMKDAEGYHRAMSVAMNPNKFAQFFYEQGKAEAIDDVSKKSKNIDMVRQAPQSFNKNGLKIRQVGDTSSGSGLRIKSIKKV
tara:strand:+ start:1189 stop:2310 length:1122 start_codon:yes stop_codon:yes gene_type:complete